MAASAAAYFEVRWRVTGSGEDWSTPQPVKPSREIVVEQLERGKAYDFEVRAVSECDAKSDWVPSSHTVPDVPAGTLVLSEIATEVTQAQAGADAANAALANIASDNLLSPVEKPVVIRDWNVISAEQAGIDAQALAFGITTEKTAYDSAVTALANYLGALTTPVMWNNLAGDTTIVGATFRTKFADVYTSRQTLLNAIYAAAKVNADSAQATGDKGVSLVTQLPVVNGGFDWDTPAGYGWVADAGTGWGFDRAGNTPGVGPNCAKRSAGTGSNTGAYRNIGLMGCHTGQTVKVQGLVKTVGVTGTAYVFISWLNAGLAEISSTASVDEVPDGVTHIRTVQQSIAETVDNSSFELALDAAGNVPGWVASGATLFARAFAYVGSQSLCIISTGNFGQAATSRRYACNFNDVYALSAAIATDPGTTGYAQIVFYNAAGGTVGSGAVLSNTGTSWAYGTAQVTVPSGAVYFLIVLNSSAAGGSSGIGAYFDTIKLSLVRSLDVEVRDGPTYGRTANADLYSSGGVNRIGLRIAGSGHKIGDQRNLTAVTFGNYGSAWNGMSLSYTSTTTSATISAAAASLYAGGVIVSYNASSVTLSGSAGSTITYYLYYDDPALSGGAKTLQATTSQLTSVSHDGRLFIAKLAVSFPASGAGGGSGGGPCVVREAWVRRRTVTGYEDVQAVSIVAGDYLRIMNPATGAKRWGRVSYSEPKLTPCVRFATADGVDLSCSTTAPIGTTTGTVLAPDLLGLRLPADDHGALTRSDVTDVHPIGEQWVQHITCEDDFFLAGNQRGRYVAHHNLKP
jgi:hypothetical protein